MVSNVKMGANTLIIGDSVVGDNSYVGNNVIIEDNVIIGLNAYIDNNTVIKSGTHIGNNAFIGANCIIGECQSDFINTRKPIVHELTIGDNCVIRSGTIIYCESSIGHNFSTGQMAIIRERTKIGNHVSIGTLNTTDGDCQIGHYVRTNTKVHIAGGTIIDSFVWLFPGVIFTNDPAPPSSLFAGAHVHAFAAIATGSIILPGRKIGQDALIGAGSVVTKNVGSYSFVSGNPAIKISDIQQLNKVFGQYIYPWRYNFSHNMPWKDKGFDEWYDLLSLDQKKEFNIVDLKF